MISDSINTYTGFKNKLKNRSRSEVVLYSRDKFFILSTLQIVSRAVLIVSMVAVVAGVFLKYVLPARTAVLNTLEVARSRFISSQCKRNPFLDRPAFKYAWFDPSSELMDCPTSLVCALTLLKTRSRIRSWSFAGVSWYELGWWVHFAPSKQ